MDSSFGCTDIATLTREMEAMEAYSEITKASVESGLEKDHDGKTPKTIDVNKPDASGDAPLHLAIKLRNKNAFDLLMEHKAIDVNKPDARGDAPLRLVMMRDTKKISMDSSFGCTDGATAIREMEAMEAYSEITKASVESGLEKDHDDKTPKKLYSSKPEKEFKKAQSCTPMASQDKKI